MARSNLAFALVPVCFACDADAIEGRAVCSRHVGTMWDEGYVPPTNVALYDAGKPRRAVERIDLKALLRRGEPLRPEMRLHTPDIGVESAAEDKPVLGEKGEEKLPVRSFWATLFSF